MVCLARTHGDQGNQIYQAELFFPRAPLSLCLPLALPTTPRVLPVWQIALTHLTHRPTNSGSWVGVMYAARQRQCRWYQGGKEPPDEYWWTMAAEFVHQPLGQVTSHNRVCSDGEGGELMLWAADSRLRNYRSFCPLDLILRSILICFGCSFIELWKESY